MGLEGDEGAVGVGPGIDAADRGVIATVAGAFTAVEVGVDGGLAVEGALAEQAELGFDLAEEVLEVVAGHGVFAALVELAVLAEDVVELVAGGGSAVIEERQGLEVEAAEVAVGELAGLGWVSEGVIALGGGAELAAEVEVEDAGGAKGMGAEAGWGFRDGEEGGEVGGELELDPVGEEEGIELAAAGFVVMDDDPAAAVWGGGAEVDAVDASAEGELAVVVEGEGPGGEAGRFHAEGDFDGDGVELVLGHPGDDGLDEILEGSGEGEGGEAVRGVGVEEAAAELGGDLGGEGSDALAGVFGGEGAPGAAFGEELFVEEAEDLVLEVAEFAGIDSEE